MVANEKHSLAEYVEIVGSKIAGLTGNVRRAVERMNKAEKKVDELSEVNHTLTDGLDKLKKDYDGLLTALEEVKAKLENTISERDRLKAEVSHAEKTEGGDVSIEGDVADLRNQLEEVQIENKDLIQQLDLLKADYVKLQESQEQLIGTIDHDDLSDADEVLIELPTGDEVADGDFAALKEKYDALLVVHKALLAEKATQDELFEEFQRQSALGTNIKTILNKRIDSTIAQLEDMLERQQ